jgi:hypothetical protein
MLILEKEQQDEEGLAWQLLLDISDTADKNLKAHINYTLAVLQQAKEMERECVHEFQHSNLDPTVIAAKRAMLDKTSIVNQRKKELDAKIHTILEKAQQ